MNIDQASKPLACFKKNGRIAEGLQSHANCRCSFSVSCSQHGHFLNNNELGSTVVDLKLVTQPKYYLALSSDTLRQSSRSQPISYCSLLCLRRFEQFVMRLVQPNGTMVYTFRQPVMQERAYHLLLSYMIVRSLTLLGLACCDSAVMSGVQSRGTEENYSIGII